MQSLNYILSLAVVLILATICTSFRHELTIYAHRNATGDSITFRSKQPDLAKWKFFWYIFSERLICYTGSWGFYSGVNYRPTIRNWGSSSTPFCTTMDLNFVNSLRHFGPLDTDIESISFYNGTMTSPTSGDEFTVLDSVEYMPFVPTAFVSTGYSNWTLYSGGNFTGAVTCYVPTAEFNSTNLGDGRYYLSARKGCPLKYDEILK